MTEQQRPARGHTALIVGDVQRAFVDAVGTDGPRVVREVNRLVRTAVADG